MSRRLILPTVDAPAVVAEAKRLLARRVTHPGRRAFLQRTLTLGGVAMISGCSLTEDDHVETALAAVSRWNDRAQAALLDPTRLAPTCDESMVVRPFPFNAHYPEAEVRQVNGATWRLELSGRVSQPSRWTLADLNAMPQQTQITRHICVEGWSAIGKWSGVPFAHVLKAAGADLSAKYVAFQCDDGYHTSIDMATALHPQTQLSLRCDGEVLSPRHGYPLKLRMPTKLGYKNPKHIRAIVVTNTYPGGYWEDQGYHWFGGS